MRFKTIACAVPLLVLASCGGDPAVEQAEGDGREASGEILPGSISDGMIPTDQLRSQPPLLREVPEAAASADAADSAEGAETEVTAPAEPQSVEEAFADDLGTGEGE